MQDCLYGDALQVVRSRLVLPTQFFGRPEKLLKTLLIIVRNVPVPRTDRLEPFIHIGITVMQLCDHHEATGLKDRLNKPMLVHELVDNLPPRYKLDWVRGKIQSAENISTSFLTCPNSRTFQHCRSTSIHVSEKIPEEILYICMIPTRWCPTKCIVDHVGFVRRQIIYAFLTRWSLQYRIPSDVLWGHRWTSLGLKILLIKYIDSINNINFVLIPSRMLRDVCNALEVFKKSSFPTPQLSQGAIRVILNSQMLKNSSNLSKRQKLVQKISTMWRT